MTHSVIVSSYNRPKMLREALESVCGKAQVIVADDGSVDEVVRLKDEYPVEWIDFSNSGGKNVFRYSIGINKAIPLCTGDVIHYLADDDIFSPNRFDDIDKYFTGMVGYGILIYFEKEYSYLWNEGWRFPKREISPEEPHPPTGLLDHNQVFHRRECFKKVPSWVVYNSPCDCEFFYALSLHYKFQPIDTVVAAKRSHGFNLMNLKKQGGGIKE